MKENLINFLSILIAALTILLSIIFSNQLQPGIIIQLLGLLIGSIGIIIWITAKITLGKYFTPSFIPKGLITKGIYLKIRHPMYLGGILLFLGIALFFKSIAGLLLTIISLLPLLIYSALQEEKLLIKKFGQDYIKYKKTTLF